MKSVSIAFAPRQRLLAGVLVCVLLLCGQLAARAQDRTISMYNIHTKETITVTFKRDGKFVPAALKELNHFMRDWRRNLEIEIDPHLIDLIWQLHEELGSRQPVHLICGYRSAQTNESLRRAGGGQARYSRHITGQAADIMFPDVPLKQLRYSALIAERGGVGFYPRSGIPFVHVDTGNVRMWPRLPRLELAALFPKGHSGYVPADGRPITREDTRIALAKWKASGQELPWLFTHRTAQPILASLGPADMPLAPQSAVFSRPALPSIDSFMRLPGEDEEPQLSNEGEEAADDIVFEPLPATFLLAPKPLSYSDVPDKKPHPQVFQRVDLLMYPRSVLASDEFSRRLQIEDLYGADRFKGPAITLMLLRRAQEMAAGAPSKSEAVR